PVVAEDEYRVRLAGDFGTGDSVCVSYTGASWSVIVPLDTLGVAAPTTIAHAELPADDHTYIDVTYKTTATNGASIIGIDNNEFSIAGLSFVAGEDPLSLGGGRYRYFLSGAFAQGPVSVLFAEGGWSQTGSIPNIAETETFLVVGPRGDLLDPSDGDSTTAKTLNDRGYLDVALPTLEGYESDEVTLLVNGVASSAVSIDVTQAPVLLRSEGTAHIFRFWTTGAYSSGAVTLDTPGGIVLPVDFLVGGIPTLNIGYLDVHYTPTAGDELITSSINGGEFGLGGAGVGTAAIMLSLMPTLVSTGTYRYYFSGDFGAGDVHVGFAPDTFSSGVWSNIAETETFTILELTADIAGPAPGGVISAEDLNNRGYFDVTYTVPEYADTLVIASVTDADPEFTVTVPGGKTLVLDTTQAPVLRMQSGKTYTFRYFYIGTAEAETITIALIGGSVTYLDAAGMAIPLFAPQDFTVYEYEHDHDGGPHTHLVVDVDFGESSTLDADSIGIGDVTFAGATVEGVEAGSTAGSFRFFVAGAGLAVGDTLAGSFTSGGWMYAGVASVVDAVPATTLPGGSYIDVLFHTVGDSPLDIDTIIDTEGAGAVEFTLSGSGLGTGASQVALSTDAPTVLADGKTVRYYLSGRFVQGPINVTFIAGSWADEAGNLGAAEVQSFYVTEPPAGASADPMAPPVPGDLSYKVFFIELSGGMELRFADLFDEPILEIRGKVALEIGNRPLPEGGTKARIALYASGTIKVIKLGNLASGAAAFILEMGSGLSDIEFWGVAAFATNFEFLEPYGIYLSGSALLQINASEHTKTETLSLEGIPGGVVLAIDALSAPAGLPTGSFTKVALPDAWKTLLKTPGTDRDADGIADGSDPLLSLLGGNGMTYKLENFAGLTDEELTDAQVEGINPGIKWKVYLKDGRYFFIEKTTSVTVNEAGEEVSSKNVFLIKGEKRTYELAPYSFQLEVVGGLRIQPEGSDPLFELGGGFLIKFSPARMDFFVCAAGEILPLGLSGRVLGLLIIDIDDADNVAEGGSEHGFNNWWPGVAGLFRLELSADPGAGVSDLDGIFELKGRVQIMFNTTRAEQVFEVPESFLNVLPDSFPTMLRIYQSRPALDGISQDVNAPANGEIYVSALIEGTIRLFDTITFSGFLSFTAGEGGVRIAGAVSTSIDYIGALSGSMDLMFLTSPSVGVVGRVTLALQAGGGIPGVAIDGQFLLEINSFDSPFTLQTFMTNYDVAKLADPDADKLAPGMGLLAENPDGSIRLGDVTIETGFHLMLFGKIGLIETGPDEYMVEIVVYAEITITDEYVQLDVVGRMKLDPIGEVGVMGYFRVDENGLALYVNAYLDMTFGESIGLDFNASATLKLNTGSQTVHYVNPIDSTFTADLEPGFELTIQGDVTFIGLASASGMVRITIKDRAFELAFEISIELGPLTVQASGFAGIYADDNPGFAMRLAVSLDLNLLDIVKIKAAGELQINTTTINRNANGVILGAQSFRLLLTGSVNILEVIKFDASFMIQVGGGNVDVGSGVTRRTFNLGPSDWVIDFSASTDFFGLATMAAKGWIHSSGSFDL
ncbi:MAG: hypothetical protein JXA36_03745, partial [Coriobacteriia bacterium]|nr:hypothetical protein [Coriobacteriia bacterium]